jgi:hypothetical protein
MFKSGSEATHVWKKPSATTKRLRRPLQEQAIYRTVPVWLA